MPGCPTTPTSFPPQCGHPSPLPPDTLPDPESDTKAVRATTATNPSWPMIHRRDTGPDTQMPRSGFLGRVPAGTPSPLLRAPGFRSPLPGSYRAGTTSWLLPPGSSASSSPAGWDRPLQARLLSLSCSWAAAAHPFVLPVPDHHDHDCSQGLGGESRGPRSVGRRATRPWIGPRPWASPPGVTALSLSGRDLF